MTGQLGYVVPLHPCGGHIRTAERNDYSQFGEDGLIEAALEKIGTTNRWCFEVGAADGVFYSNTKTLRDKQWEAVLIEGNQTQFNALLADSTSREHCVHEQIGPQSLDRILSAQHCPTGPDFGVIDIDGQDFWVWAGMRIYQPRLLLVEFEPRDEHDEAYFVPKLGGDGQATLGPICDLGRATGYEPILRTHCNVLFVLRELLWAK